VQEWIEAGGAVTDEIPLGLMAPTEISKSVETEIPGERRPGVVRILEGRRSEPAPEHVVEIPAQAPISEQMFELSIGSISVVVEGEGKVPAAAAPIAAHPSQRAEERPSSVSRLSRHYL